MFLPNSGGVLVVLMILSLNAIMELTLRGLQLALAVRPALAMRPAPPGIPRQAGDLQDRQPFVSVHIATHAEPPELVIATLEKLAASRFAAFEVIVLDNNTQDARLWRPVAQATARLGPRFAFVHLDGVRGAKAGALNEALRRADPRTTHVAVVDADYQVSPAFLSDAMTALARHGVDYVQFPQAYRAVSEHAVGVERELGDYFSSFARQADRIVPMLPTGTLSLFSASALRAIGGWSSRSITEDAEIGVRLQAAGYRGMWVSRERGQGLLPLDFTGLRTQRARWAAGNFQVLQRLCSPSRPSRALPLSASEWLKLVVQLTAWLSLWGLPAIALVASAGLRGPLAPLIGAVAAATVCGSAVLTAARMAIVGRGNGGYVQALATRLSLTWTSATAWLPALLGAPLPFRRTQKAIGRGAMADNAAPDGIIPAMVAIGYACLAGLYASRTRPLEMLACGLLAGVWPCAALVDRNLKASAQLNPELA